jgi:hypothetical protein
VSKHDGKRRPRIDWDAAFAYFCSDPTTTFTGVARQFHVSHTAVCKHAKRDNWNDQRAKLLDQAANGALQRVRRTRQERIQKVLELVDTVVEGFTDERLAEAKVSDVPALVKLAELLEGEATDRVDIRRVQPVIVAFVTRVARHVPKDAQTEFAADLDWLEGELLAIESPNGDAS